MSYIVPPCSKQLELLYVDSDFAVVNKPDGLLSVPGKHPKNKDSAYTRLVKNYPNIQVVHRLDLDTSGLMVFALHKDSQRILNKQFQERQVLKKYLAEVWGFVPIKYQSIELPIRCDWPNRPKQIVDYEFGKSALTYCEVIKVIHESTVVYLKPVTGRTHQLRVHMKSIGHPILGDQFYAHEKALISRSRLHLHAVELVFYHPRTNRKVVFKSEPSFFI